MFGAVQILRDWVFPMAGVCATVIGSYVALVGLSTWKRQLQGQTDHELARRILVALYKYRDAISGVRHPAMFGNELPDPPESEREKMSSPQISFYGLAHAYQNRWAKVQAQRAELYAGLLEAEAIWGDELRARIFPRIYSLEWELQTCVQNHLELRDPDGSDVNKQAIITIKKGKRDILYGSLKEEGDEFTRELASAIKVVEEYLKPKLARS